MIDLNKLKELALIWSRSDVACMEVVTFSDLSSTPLDDAQVMFGAANALGDLIDRLEAAGALADFRGKNISSLDNLIADRDKRIAELEAEAEREDVITIDALDSMREWRLRAETAEAEIKRRDAAAVEPVYQERRYQFIGKRQLEYWADVNKDFYRHLPESEKRIIYLSTPPAPSAPDGWKLVPVEPTEKMVINGFESRPDEDFSEPTVWEKYTQMSGCQQAAYKAQLCWADMLAAAPAPGG